jgi:phage FluMu gp28-like protein
MRILQCIADAEVAADLTHVDRLARVDEGRVARDHGEIGKARQHADDVFADAIAQVAETFVLAQIVERQDCN